MASSVIGALRVNLGLDSAQFSKGAKRVSNRVQTMRRQFIAVAGVATLAGAAVVGIARRGAADLDNAAKSARRLGASVGGLEALKLAASEAGVPLSGMTNDLQNINREIASIGVSGNAGRALKALGIEASELAGLDADEKVARIADRVRDLGLTSGQATAILRDLGVRNREMVLLMMQGGDAIRKARKDIEEYGLAVDAVDAAKIEAANDKIARLGLIGRYAAQQIAQQVVPALGEMAQALTDSLRPGGALRAMIDGLVSALPRLSAWVATAVGLVGARFVAAFVAARVAAFSFAGALTVVRGAMLRTGIGGMIIIAGELVYRFLRLVRVAGGVGEAFRLIGDVAREAFERIGLVLDASGFRIQAWALGAKASVLDWVDASIRNVVFFGDRAAAVFTGAYEALRASFGKIPAAVGDFAYQAANSLIAGVEAMLNAVVKRINKFVEMLNSALAHLPDWATGGQQVKIGVLGDVDLGRIDNQFSGAAAEAGSAAAEAFKGAWARTFVKPPETGLGQIAAEYREAVGTARKLGDGFMGAARKPLKSWQVIKALFGKTKDELDDIPPTANQAGDALANAGGKAAGGAQKMADAMARVREQTKRGADAMENVFGAMLDGADSVREAVANLLKEIAKIQFTKGMMGLLGSSGIGGTILQGIGSLLGANANGTSNWRGGLTRINERGGEIVDLPKGTRIIPHDVSNRMADRAGAGEDRYIHITASFDETGNLFVKQVAEQAATAMGAKINRALPARVQQIQQKPWRR